VTVFNHERSGEQVKYSLKFYGRKVGSIGLGQWWLFAVEADSEQQAREKAYETHEHIDGGLEGIEVKPVS